MKTRGSRRLIKWLGLALALAAFAAPSAQAVLPTDSGALVSAPSRHLGYAPINTRVQLPAEPRGYAPINTRVQLPLVRTDVPLVSGAAVSESSSFNWGDAGIGAGIMLLLVGFGAAILAGRHLHRSRLSVA